MVLDSKLQTLRDHFGIHQPEDWCRVSPASILSVPDIGPQTLNHLRLMLANRGLTLAGDATPLHWQTHLDAMRGASQVAGTDRSVVCPFRVLVDADEKMPFTFQGLRADADRQNRPLIVETVTKHLGDSRGDYSIEGFEGEVHIERKSLRDAQGTVLGWGERRDRFERTLAFLAEIPSSLIVVECPFGEAIATCRDTPSRSARQNAKSFSRQVLAWMDDYRVPWVFAQDRRHAEAVTFRWLERHWRRAQSEAKAAQKTAQQSIFNDPNL